MTISAVSPALAANLAAQSSYFQPGRRGAVFERFLAVAPLVSPHDQTLLSLSAPNHVYAHLLRIGDRVFPAARIQDENVLAEYGRLLGYRGLDYKGGIRFHPDVTLGKNKELAFEMTLKNAVVAPSFDPADAMEAGARLFMGGGKGTVRVDPSTLTDQELVQLAAEYGRTFASHLAGPDWHPIDVPAPDVNTIGRYMQIMTDEYSRQAGRRVWSVFTGKRIEDGGIYVRDEATARGGFIVLEWLLRETLKIDGNPFEGRTFAIDGFGNAGSFMAQIVTSRGGRVLAFSDSRGGLRSKNPEGFTADEIGNFLALKEEERKQRTRLFDRNLDPKDLLAMDADVLVLAAPDLTLTGSNADRVRAKYIVELGNGVTNTEADKILQEKGVILLPDILANAGGVMVSGYEYLQGREWERLAPNAPRHWWTRDYVMGLLSQQMTAAAAAVYGLAVQHSIALRTAADAKALKTLDRAYRVVRLGEKDPGGGRHSGRQPRDGAPEDVKRALDDIDSPAGGGNGQGQETPLDASETGS
ncbi:MAG TPA: Glu/Leu/Phe/Val dehydrogenase [bacterium]|nr:Glu/Leu/Phe/Val dehydrogenase [bacterium]